MYRSRRGAHGHEEGTKPRTALAASSRGGAEREDACRSRTGSPRSPYGCAEQQQQKEEKEHSELLLISFAVRIQWRSGTSLSPAHVLLPISLLSLMYTFTIFDSFCSYGAFRRTTSHTHTNSSDSCLRCKGTLAKCRYVDDLKRYFQSSLALLLTRGINGQRCFPSP